MNSSPIDGEAVNGERLLPPRMVSDEQAASLLGRLKMAIDEQGDLVVGDDCSHDAVYAVLVECAFTMVAARRFGYDAESAEVIRFVARLRNQRRKRRMPDCEPSVAEKTILGACLGSERLVMGIDFRDRFRVIEVVLPAVVRELQFDDSDLVALVLAARERADGRLAR